MEIKEVKMAKKNKKRELAESIVDEAYNYNNFVPFQNPSATMYCILLALAGREDEIRKLFGLPLTAGFGWEELKLLKKWINKLDKIAENYDDVDEILEYIEEIERM
ncbi:hypothetical protein DRJ19_01840 [Candidatus Woesearchaeota archaeon]|nr:MAG: hypothetical protein DRJ19_01840 [Candidatus Woesearchaeota archaeon]